MTQMIDCFEVTDIGIRAVSVSVPQFYLGKAPYRFWDDIKDARLIFEDERGYPQKPRVPPRTAVGVVVSP